MATTAAQMKRELRAIALRLAGRHPPPLLKGWPRSVPPEATTTRASAAAKDARTLEVAAVVPVASEAFTLVLRAPDGARFDFAPGQFFTLLTEVDGAIVPRNYSASNAPGSSELHLTFKVKGGGVVSPRLARLRAGDEVRALGPFGSFVPSATAPAGGRRLVLVAGGAGVTPLMSIATSLLTSEPDARIAFVVGSRSPADVVLGAALSLLASEHGARLSLLHVLERDAGDGTHPGRLDRATTAAVLDALPLASAPGARFFVCGPDGMRDEVLAALASRGTAPGAIFVERFTTGPRPRADRVPAAGDVPLVDIRIRGQRARTTALPGATLLEAGLAAGLPMPFSCGVGGCGACRVRRVSGDIVVEEPNCLSPAERATGYVLACVGRPSGPCEIEVEEV